MGTVVIDFRAFCDDSGYLGNPFVINGHKYATDGRILIRTVTDEADSEQLRGVKHAPGLFEGFPDETSMVPWPESNPVWEMQECDECPDDECGTCDGMGWIHCDHCGNESDCDDCDGHGGLPGDCDVCNNTRKVNRPAKQAVGSEVVAYKYDQLVRTLTGVRYAIFDSHGAEAVAFRFDGGEGILMPLSKA